ncbi:head-to-tail adaptor [Mycobacterium phage Equemioh13]|uniref:Head-to-tail adaptor n=2 Tax=Turbidovirus TaxID=2948936 RepID=A0A076YKJ1_9CAUD|nr:head-tail adaptor Ad1 [Mycobacterium phage Piro94]YP_009203289.1 head-tail adaptor Ad1 [Mycobacterium phage Equemioh13]YP_010063635.1 head-tail adaptor Ad1 [Mycobacterium phage Centaur]AMB18508.1 head-to-tail adaptor [Mycobacterium phage NaSiaTalie]ASZ72809.1 head-to-tail adaptor [Mycobacterium phage Drake55]ATN92287.1 head-to-tail adaptor [Mycobacterium phage Updawg]AYD86293.1 head-to-tail adaptor [Mycobacterium phage Flare16]QDM57221.1 head-to-tail adaptor [Mycobacterium phage WideWale]
MAYATANDVVTLWAKEPEPEVMALIGRRLEQVERMIKRRIPDLVVKAAASTTFKADLIDIEADAVLRLVRNPEGYLSETDGAYTYQLQSDLSQGKLTILDEEWETLGVNSIKRMGVIVPNLVMPT